jgi:phospholipase/carboxylesterase
MSSRALPTVEVEPERPARATVVFLHGLGADGHDFEPVVPYLGLDPALAVRFVFPHAPSRGVTINRGMIMPAWYDIRSGDLRADVDEQGIRESARAVAALVERERGRGIEPRNIVLGGFSQGGAIALHAALRYPERLAGVIALSTYLVLADSLPAEASAANRDLPVFMAHGTRDPMVAFERGDWSRQHLAEQGYPVEWHTYPMQHEVAPREIEDMSRWIASVLGARS